MALYTKGYGTRKPYRATNPCALCDTVTSGGNRKFSLCRSCRDGVYTCDSNFRLVPCWLCKGDTIKTSKRRHDLKYFCNNCNATGFARCMKPQIAQMIADMTLARKLEFDKHDNAQ
jgi:hypothetical protein